MDLALELDLLVIVVWRVPFRKAGLASVKVGLAYAFGRLRVSGKAMSYWRFWMSMNESTILPVIRTSSEQLERVVTTRGAI